MNHYYPKQSQPGRKPTFKRTSLFCHSCEIKHLTRRTTCHRCSTKLTVSCLFQYDLILLCDKNSLPFIHYTCSLVDLNILGGKCLNPRL